MREATGELNMTVIILVGVGILMAFFYTILWPMLRNNFTANTRCADAICDKNSVNQNDGTVECTYFNENGTPEAELVCPWKG